MDAIISGRAGVAFLVEGEVLSSFDVEDPATLLPRRPADLRLLFGETPDLEFFEGVDHPEAARHLERAFNCASALDLALILFDPELTDDLRDDAAEELERLLSERPVSDYLENVLHSSPLPATADLPGAIARCHGGRLPKLSEVLQILEGYQPSIRAARAAWDDLPTQLFGGDEQKAQFQHLAVREGLFRQLASEVANGPGARLGEFILRAGINRSITSLRNHREVLQQWIRPFRTHAAAPRVTHEVEDFLDEAPTTRRDRRRRRKRGSADEELNKLRGQLDLIVAAMQRRDLPLARKITDEVIVYQSSTTKPIQAAKTLCNLASKAKALGIYSLLIELTERAIQIAPDDGWAWAQHADALLNVQKPTEALKAYEQAEAFGAGVIAKSGRAKALRILGRLDEVLTVYDVINAEYPNSVIPKIGRAEVLRSLGQLVDALAAYDAIIAQHPENVIAKTGRAEVLKDLGRLVDALAAYEDTIIEHPENVIAKIMRANTLTALGNYHEALAAYDSIVAEHPENFVAKTGRAETLRALGRLPEALAAYDSAITQHPEDVAAKVGHAETLRAMERLHEALAAYDSIVAEYPESVSAKKGLADVLKALGRIAEVHTLNKSTVVKAPKNIEAKEVNTDVVKEMKGVNMELHLDWLNYHMQGIQLLITGNVKEGFHVIEQGAIRNRESLA